MTYDHNGNIKTLERKQRKHELSGVIASYTSETIDNLTYNYRTTDANNLTKVTDAASLAAGFDNGTSSTNNDYKYDINGNLTSDKNKGIDSIYYNFLGKPVRMDFADGKKIEYTYDAAGMKLTQKLYSNDTLKTTTHYVNGFVYEAVESGSPVLSFFGSPEGRVVNNGGTLNYEYSIADHQGNTRVVFSSQATTTTSTANFEGSTNEGFQNYGNRINFELMDHTDFSGSTYSYTQKLTGGAGAQVGVTKSMKVYPGDKVKIEAYGKYYNPSGSSGNITGFAAALTSAFGVSGGSTGEALKAYNALNDYGAFIAAGGPDGTDEDYPKLFVNILLFDKDHNFIDAAWEQIDGGEQVGTTPKAAHDYMSREVTVKEAGYAYVFISNENPTLVEFYVDDVAITHTPTNVIQYNEYYPFGLQTSTSWTREATKDNSYLYNAANELNKTSGWYEMYYRGYDPAIGRMLQVDPYATMYASSTTYNYALNNPVMMNDPNGGQAHDNVDRLPAWGSKRIGYGSGNHWSEGIGYDGWSLDGRSEIFDAMLYGGYMPTGGGGFFVQGMQLNDPRKYGYSGGTFGYLLEYNTNEPATDVPDGLQGTILNQSTIHSLFIEIETDKKLAYGVAFTSFGLDFMNSIITETYTDVNGIVRSVYKNKPNGRPVLKNGKLVPNSAKAATKLKGMSALGTLGTLANLTGLLLDVKEGNDKGWTKDNQKDVTLGLATFGPYGWIMVSFYTGVESNAELVRNGTTTLDRAPMSIIPGLGPAGYYK
jgi:RHS repeat-associated protein